MGSNLNNLSFLEFISEYSFDFKKAIKEVYILKKDINVLFWEKIFISELEFKELKFLAEKKLSGLDITFDIGYRYFRNNKFLLKRKVFCSSIWYWKDNWFSFRKKYS